MYHIEQQMQTLKNRLVSDFTDASRLRATAPRDGPAEATASANQALSLFHGEYLPLVPAETSAV